MSTDEGFRAAEARLFQLLEQGVIHSIGAVQEDHRAEFFIGVDAQTDPQADDYDAHKLSIIRGRLNEALQGIPFSILGEYSEEPRSAANNKLAATTNVQLSKDSAELATSSSVPADVGASLTSRMQNPSQLDSSDNVTHKELAGIDKVIYSAIDPVRADINLLIKEINNLNRDIVQLENLIEKLPSRGLVITIAIITVTLIVPSILFQGHGPSLLLGLRKLFGM
jgi:hypothetical protein